MIYPDREEKKENFPSAADRGGDDPPSSIVAKACTPGEEGRKGSATRYRLCGKGKKGSSSLTFDPEKKGA